MKEVTILLANPEMFERVESFLRKNGTIERFEKENGPIRGRMMITHSAPPDWLSIMERENEQPVAFEATFDFYDATAGIMLFLSDYSAASGTWTTEQAEGAETPAMEWVEFFLKTLLESFNEDGSYGIPIYSLISDTNDITVIPTAEK